MTDPTSTSDSILKLVAAMERAKATKRTDTEEQKLEAAKRLGNSIIDLLATAQAEAVIDDGEIFHTLAGVIGVCLKSATSDPLKRLLAVGEIAGLILDAATQD